MLSGLSGLSALSGVVGEFVPPPIVPTDIAGLSAWLDANDLTTLFQTETVGVPVTADSDPVGTWLDKSGNVRHHRQVTSSRRPTYKTNIQNGKPAILFDGVDDRLVADLNLGISGAAARTMFAVAKWGAVAGTQRVAVSLGATGTGTAFALTASSGNWYFSGYSADQGNGAADTNWHAHRLTYDGTQVDWLLDGTRLSSFPSTIALNTTNAPSLVGIRVDGAQPMSGYIAEVLIYDSLLSAGDAAAVEAYLRSKWGTP